MSLPLCPPVEPQLALSRKELPTGEGWVHEPKMDGFRAIVFVDGDEVHLQSRGARALGRYFPELAFPAGRYVLDGEIVVPTPAGGQDFEALQGRIHPAESRIRRLAEETPAAFVAFDLLAEGDQALLELPFAERRGRLEALAPSGVGLAEQAAGPAGAEPWMRTGEGVVSKDLAAPYIPGKRHGMVKVKRVRTLDCVVAGYRPGKAPDTVGALMLGLYDERGELRVIGHAAGFTAAEKRALVGRLAPHESGERGSADPSRWSAGRELGWVALRPELVVEVAIDHVSAGRIRHGGRLLRWREDRDPASCGIGQLAR